MKSFILLTAALLALGACSPATAPAPAKAQGLCRNMNCKIDGVSSEVYFRKFMVGVEGSCDKPETMSFTSAIAEAVLPKDSTGFAQIHLYLKDDGTYKGAYAEPVGPFGALNPVTQGHIKSTKISGTWYLENDKIGIEGVGIGRKNTADQILVRPISSSTLSMTSLALVSFTQMKASVDDQGQTVAQYCATKAKAQ